MNLLQLFSESPHEPDSSIAGQMIGSEIQKRNPRTEDEREKWWEVVESVPFREWRQYLTFELQQLYFKRIGK